MVFAIVLSTFSIVCLLGTFKPCQNEAAVVLRPDLGQIKPFAILIMRSCTLTLKNHNLQFCQIYKRSGPVFGECLRGST